MKEQMETKSGLVEKKKDERNIKGTGWVVGGSDADEKVKEKGEKKENTRKREGAKSGRRKGAGWKG